MPTWETATDWDNAQSEGGVAHESVANTDHNDATIVKQGYPINTPLYSPNLFYPFHEDSGSTAYDFGSSGVNATIESGVTVGVAGILSTTAHSFSGNDSSGNSVGVGDIDILSGSSATLCAWIYVSSFNSGSTDTGHFSDTHGQIIGKQGSSASDSGDNYELGVLDNGQVGWYVDAGSGSTVVEGGSLSTGTWYFLAATYSSSNGDIEIFVDASSVGTNTASTGGLGGNNNPIGIGSIADDGGNYGDNYFTFDGRISHPMFFNKVLTNSEIQNLYDVANTNGSLTTTSQSL